MVKPSGPVSMVAEPFMADVSGVEWKVESRSPPTARPESAP